MCDDGWQAFLYLWHTCSGPIPDDVLRALAEGMGEMPAHLRELGRLDGTVHVRERGRRASDVGRSQESLP